MAEGDNGLGGFYATPSRAAQDDPAKGLMPFFIAGVAWTDHATASRQIAQQKNRGDNHWETLRSIREFAREGDCERIIQWVNDAGQGYVESAEKTLGEMTDRALAATRQIAELRSRVAVLEQCLEAAITHDKQTHDRALAAEAENTRLREALENVRAHFRFHRDWDQAEIIDQALAAKEAGE